MKTRYPYVVWEGKVSYKVYRVVHFSKTTLVVERCGGHDSMGVLQWIPVRDERATDVLAKAMLHVVNNGG